MQDRKHKRIALLTLTVLLCIAGLLVSIFLLGRFGWKLRGFRACEGAGIEKVQVTDGCVQLEGFYPGSFPEGFIGYYAKEADGKLYVGFRFSAVFGFFETGDFSISIPVRGEINEVIVKTSTREYSVWTAEGGPIPGSEQYGIFIRMDYPDVGTVSVSYCGKMAEQDAWENGEYVFFDCDIMMEAKNAEEPIPFVITLKNAAGSAIASKAFLFDAQMEKMYITITESGKIEIQ